MTDQKKNEKSMIQEPLFIRDQVKSSLSSDVQKEYNKLLETTIQIPIKHRTTKKIDGTGGKVSVSDIIAYQIGWGTLLNGWYEAGIKGEIPEMPGDGFKKWNYTLLALHFYKKYQFDSSQEQNLAFNRVVKQILSNVEREYLTGNLDKIGVWQWCTLSSGKKWPLSKWVKINTSSPYKKANILVQKFIKTIK